MKMYVALILEVENDDEVRNSINGALEGAGYHVLDYIIEDTEASNLEDANT